MSGIFLDTLGANVKRMQHINQTLANLSLTARASIEMQRVELLVIAPLECIDVIVSRHSALPPAGLRSMMGCPRASSQREATQASALASYLLFDSGFTRELMA